jgi:hypothetical protein
MVEENLVTSATPQQVAPQSNETISMLERAEKLHKETKEAEERIQNHRKAIEELETRRIMGGVTQAGSITKTPEQIQQDKANELANDIVGAFKRR